MFVAILGLAAIAATVISLIRSRMLPAMAFILWPSLLAMAMVAGGRCSFADIEAMLKAGFAITAPTAALFVFSVLFFGIMTDAGLFNVLIKKLMTLMGDNVIGIALVTAIMALAAQLDGGGASTFCIVIPAMFPVCMELLVPVPVVRHFHWTCSILSSIAH